MGVIDDIKTNLRNAYTKLETKGATIPAHKNMENLESTIDSVAVAKEEQTKTVDLAMASGNQVVTPDTNKVLSQVTINKPATLLAENIKNGVNIGGVVGSFAGGASLKIHYGNTAPSDTTKLWVKSTDPTEIEISGGSGSSGEQTFLSAGTIPQPNTSGASAKVGTKIYYFGGSRNYTAQNEIYIYDTETNTTQTSNVTLPTASIRIYAYHYNGKIYIGCGEPQISFIYDITTDTITSAPRNIAFRNAVMVGIGKYIYSFGGYTGGSGYITYIYKYDIENDTITNVGTLPNGGSYGMAICLVGTKIYLFGKNPGDIGICIFDTTTDTLSVSSTAIPVSDTQYAATYNIGNEIYVRKNSSNQFKYNIITDTVEVTNITVSVSVTGVKTQYINGSYYFVGCGDGVVLKLPVQIPLQQDKMLLTYDTNGDFKIIDTETIKLKINPVDCFKGNSSDIGEQVKIALYDTTQQDWVEIN